MNDPWDVKSVRRSGQYISCMKINGVPLLPPVLSKECRKEMQYYQLLAKEVEKRITHLKSYVSKSDTDTSDDVNEAPRLDLKEICYVSQEVACSDNSINKGLILNSSPENPSPNKKNMLIQNISECSQPKFEIDLSFKTIKNLPCDDKPERDCECFKSNKQCLSKCKNYISKEKVLIEDFVQFRFEKNRHISNPFPEIPFNQDGPSSLSSKSFTGSLNNIYTESLKEILDVPKLLRQRSYTLLNPSPQLLAHLEVQSLNTGVEVSSISMSESLSNLSSPNKKRRSWDLETAKVKWSSMAIELNKKTATTNTKANLGQKNHVARSQVKKSPNQNPQQRTRSLATVEKNRMVNVTPKSLKSEPIRSQIKSRSPVINVNSNKVAAKETNHHKSPSTKVDNNKPAQVISESQDPATKVRELYEKIQKQQLVQMASLVEKQKREQMLLQQVFEEQNNLLFKQLKTICPTSPNEVKEAWGEKQQEISENGPVSLSQLINDRSTDNTEINDQTLINTNIYITKCDDVLRKSKILSNSVKRKENQTPTKLQNAQNQKTKPNLEGSRTRTNSPNARTSVASRKLNYDTSESSNRECEPILTDRTNDTLADINVTFPSDHSEDCHQYSGGVFMPHCSKLMQCIPNAAMITNGQCIVGTNLECTDTAIRNMGETIRNSMNNTGVRLSTAKSHPTPQELQASSKIVAYAKGYLVRRLMRTDRVQATVQTINDALLCALQLHQDRHGIRGTDVDLHRRLIQQITAACYSIHDAFISSTPGERCAWISADRQRKRLASTRTSPRNYRPTNIMSKSYSGAFPLQHKRPHTTSLMTQSHYETFSSKNPGGRHPNPRKAWR